MERWREREEVPENPVRRRRRGRRRRGWPLTEVEVPVAVAGRRRRRGGALTEVKVHVTLPVTGGGDGGVWSLIGGVLNSSRGAVAPNDPPVHPNRGFINRGRLVSRLDLHAPEPLPVPPLQHEIGRRSRLRAAPVKTIAADARRPLSLVASACAAAVGGVGMALHRFLVHSPSSYSAPLRTCPVQ